MRLVRNLVLPKTKEVYGNCKLSCYWICARSHLSRDLVLKLKQIPLQFVSTAFSYPWDLLRLSSRLRPCSRKATENWGDINNMMAQDKPPSKNQSFLYLCHSSLRILLWYSTIKAVAGDLLLNFILFFDIMYSFEEPIDAPWQDQRCVKLWGVSLEVDERVISYIFNEDSSLM